jgi:hypothetical protein
LKSHADLGEKKKNCMSGQSASAPRRKLEQDRNRNKAGGRANRALRKLKPEQN